jgi:glycosyltransferase involved in cell wall biosynthesis
MNVTLDKNKPYIIYVGSVEVPSASAASRRILGNAKAIKYAGYNVLIGGAQQGEQGYITHEGIDIFEVGERKYENLPTLLKYLAYARMGKLTVEWLDTLDCDIEAVVLYSGYSPYLLRLLPWCKKRNIPLVFDAVEWYVAPTKLQALFNPYYWNIELAMRYLIPKTKNVICISSYLQRYYHSKNCNTVVLPPLLDIKSFENSIEFFLDNTFILSFTGRPGLKEIFDNYLEAVLTIHEKKLLSKKVVLHVAGLPNNEVLMYPSCKKRGLTALPEYIINEGFVSIKRCLEITAASHFSVLQRNNNRVCQAGFPTKFVESLSLGTPVIANEISDVCDYIIDNKSGIICKGESTNDLLDAILKAASFSGSRYLSFRINAQIYATKYFDIKIQKGSIIEFINNLRK